jgi:hypothetical protein
VPGHGEEKVVPRDPDSSLSEPFMLITNVFEI